MLHLSLTQTLMLSRMHHLLAYGQATILYLHYVINKMLKNCAYWV